MIKIINKIDCCGCNACGDLCAHGAITFKTDMEGFWYPEVDASKCVECGLCEKVCPMLHKGAKNNNVPKVYGAYTKDETVRLDSTSGGIFSELATAFFHEGGAVAGAIYNEEHTVSHIVTPDAALLPQIRSSKYLQSDAQGIYKQILNELKAGQKVLFCGTPCQVHALKNFITTKYQTNLTTTDFICRGVNSPKVWLKYIGMLEKQYASKVVEIKAKNKKWGWHRFSMRMNFANGQEYCKDRYNDLFFVGYLQAGNFCRPSCYECKFKGFPQASDITLADFWGIEDLDPSMDQDKGTSLVLTNTAKGKQLLDAIHDRVEMKEFPSDIIKMKQDANKSLISRVNNREEFFKALDSLPFEELAKKFFLHKSLDKKVSILRRIWRRIKFEKNIIFQSKKSVFNLIKYIKWNYFSKQIIHSNKQRIVPLSDTILQLDANSKITINGGFRVGSQQVLGARQQTRIWLEEGAELIVNGNFTIGADSYIRVCKNSKLILHDGFFNEHVQVTAGDVVEIEDGCAIGRDVVIRSYDGHSVVANEYKIAKPIHIGKHVWVGQGANILKGVNIGMGTIVAANAVLTKDVPEKCLVGGNPAKIIREKIEWK